MVLLDVDYGLLIGILISILMIVIRDQFFQIRNLIEYKSSSHFVDDKLTLNNDNNYQVWFNIFKNLEF